MAVSKEDIRNLLRLFDQSDWQEMRVEIEGLKLAVSKRAPLATPPAAFSPLPQTAPAPSLPTPEPPGAAPASATALPAVDAPGPGQSAIRAPNLGSFWRQPKPGTPPFVAAGQLVEDDTTVCIIEVMKLFTPVKAGLRGRIARVCAVDGQMVEYNAPLFIVDPV